MKKKENANRNEETTLKQLKKKEKEKKGKKKFEKFFKQERKND